MAIGPYLGGQAPGTKPEQGYRLENPVCPACGWETHAEFEWCPGAANGSVICYPLKREPRTYEKALSKLPHLHRKCQLCKYMWIEPCLDADIVTFKDP